MMSHSRVSFTLLDNAWISISALALPANRLTSGSRRGKLTTYFTARSRSPYVKPPKTFCMSDTTCALHALTIVSAQICDNLVQGSKDLVITSIFALNGTLYGSSRVTWLQNNKQLNVSLVDACDLDSYKPLNYVPNIIQVDRLHRYPRVAPKTKAIRLAIRRL